MRSNSSGVRPCSLTNCGVTGGSRIVFGIESVTLANVCVPSTREGVRSHRINVKIGRIRPCPRQSNKERASSRKRAAPWLSGPGVKIQTKRRKNEKEYPDIGLRADYAFGVR